MSFLSLSFLVVFVLAVLYIGAADRADFLRFGLQTLNLEVVTTEAVLFAAMGSIRLLLIVVKEAVLFATAGSIQLSSRQIVAILSSHISLTLFF